MNPARNHRALIAAVWCGLMIVGPPAAAASSVPPSEPQLDPLPACATFCDSRYSMIESPTPLLEATSTDPDSSSLTYTFTIEDYMTDVVLASKQFVLPPGETVRWQVEAGVLTGGTTYRWNVTVRDESTTVSNDRYFSYHPPVTLGERLGGAAAEAAISVLFTLPYLGIGVAVLGLGVLPWSRRAGAWMLVVGLAIAAIAVVAILQLLGGIGS